MLVEGGVDNVNQCSLEASCFGALSLSTFSCRDEKSQLLLGIKRANRQQPTLSSSVISSDSMHIEILAAANNNPFTIFYNPRASPCEFVIPLAKYNKAMYTQVSIGMRFWMMFEIEESGVIQFGVPNMLYKLRCANDLAVSDNSVLNNNAWTNQTQCMRTYTKVVDVSR